MDEIIRDAFGQRIKAGDRVCWGVKQGGVLADSPTGRLRGGTVVSWHRNRWDYVVVNVRPDRQGAVKGDFPFAPRCLAVLLA